MSDESRKSLEKKNKAKSKSKAKNTEGTGSISTAPMPNVSQDAEDCSSTLTALTEGPSTKKVTEAATDRGCTSITPAQHTPQTPTKKKRPIIGYVHSLSPVKRNKLETYDYSTMTIQTSDDEIRETLLYSPRKCTILSKSEESRMPVKIQNYTFTEDGKKLIINDMCKLSIPDQSEYAFQFNKNASLAYPQLSISDVLEKCEQWDKVEITAKVVKFLPETTVKIKGGDDELRLAQAVLCDSSGSMRLDVWQEHIDEIKEGSVYQMCPLQVCVWSQQKKLATVIQTRITTVVNEVLETLTTSEDPDPGSTVISVTQIISVEKVEKMWYCINCRKPIMQTSAGLFARCDRCGHTMRVRDCTEDFKVRFLFTSKDDKKVSLLVYQNVINTILGDVSEESSLAEGLLLLENVSITFNNDNHIVTEMKSGVF